jgi:hypothetical protein
MRVLSASLFSPDEATASDENRPPTDTRQGQGERFKSGVVIADQ